MSMKILQLIQRPQLRGAEIFACQLAQEFLAKNIQADVGYLFGNDRKELQYDLKFIPVNANSSRRLWDLKAYSNLNRIVRKGKYNVVQANAGDTLKYAVMSKLIFHWDAKIVFRNASLMSRLMYSPFQRMYNRWLLQKCDHIISVSENCRQDLIGFFPAVKEYSTTIRSGTYWFEDLAAKKPAGQESPIFIHVGSFVWEKNHTFLLNVFKRYVDRYKHGYLWLVGDGKLHAEIKEKVLETGLEERVFFWGVRRDVISILKAADVLLMPSVVEGIPGVILEALSCGIPVLASSAGGIPEVIDHGTNGFCLAGFKEDDYVEHMHALVTDNILRSKFMDAGRKTVGSSYVMPLIADKFLNCYAGL
jgi:L-malate glycosyltransferase